MKSNLVLFVFVGSAVLAVIFTPAFCDAAGKPTAHRSPEPVHDLRAVRKGDKVTLSWIQPREMGEGASALRVTSARICRGISAPVAAADSPAAPSGTSCAEAVGEVPVETAASSKPTKSASTVTLRFSDTLPKKLMSAEPLRYATYRVELRDGQKRSLGFSNPASVALAPTVPPGELHFQLDVRGVYLIWTQETENHSPLIEFDYRIYRSKKGSRDRVSIPYFRATIYQREEQRWTGIDPSIEWETNYTYWVTPLTKIYSGSPRKLVAEIEGEDSEPVEVTTHDVFPPAKPEGLLAVASQIPTEKFVDLIWAPNTERDLAGYNIYRREATDRRTDSQNGKPQRISAAPAAMVSFHDVNVVAGHKYFYSVSAVDVRGNESTRSEETAEVSP